MTNNGGWDERWNQSSTPGDNTPGAGGPSGSGPSDDSRYMPPESRPNTARPDRPSSPEASSHEPQNSGSSTGQPTQSEHASSALSMQSPSPRLPGQGTPHQPAQSGPQTAPITPPPGPRPGTAAPSDQYWGYPLKPAKAPRNGGNASSSRSRGFGATAAIVLVAALIGGAGGAGIMYGLSEPVQQPAAEQQVEVRTVAAADSVDWVAIADQVQPSVVAIQAVSNSGGSTGSGVIMDGDGHIITNHHVVAGARQIQVTLSNGRIIAAEIVGSDASTDLAVLKLSNVPSDIAPATLGSSDDLVVGEPVVAIGNPLGLSSTVTTGIISALDRPVVTREDVNTDAVVTNAIQIDAAINPGNSGGPLFNAQGEVIGINSSIASLSSADGGSSGSIGLGFAIPIDLVDRVVSDLIEDGSVDHAFIGVTTTSEVVTIDGISQVAARVVEVSPSSPAEEHGIEQGDAILSINGDQLASNTALTGYVRQYAPGETIILEVARDGDVQEVDLVLGQRQ